MADILRDGWWCRECEFFEPEEDMDGEFCLSCGCAKGNHVEVVIVTPDALKSQP